MTFSYDFRSHPMRWMPIALLLVVFALHLPAFVDRVLNNDEAYIATVADVLGNGGRLYVDTVDRKPPGVFYLYHWLFEITGSRALWIPRMLGVVAHTATAVLVWAFARRRFDERAAMLTGLLAAFASVTVTPNDARSAVFEVFMMPFLVAAMLLADRRQPFTAGLAIGVATMMKQTAAVTLLPLTFVLWRRREQRWSGSSLLALGAALPVVACALVFDADRFWFWVFGAANGAYLDLGPGGIGIVLDRFVSMTASMVGLNVGLLFLTAVAVRSWRTDLDLWLWLLSASIGVASGARFFGHYYWQLMPPLCLLAGRGLSLVSRRMGAAAVSIAGATAVATVVAAVALGLGGASRDYEPLADYARAHTAPTDRIFVWGHEPSVFWAADRLPASRIITTGFLTGHSAVRPKNSDGIDKAVPGIWDDVMADLAEHPPVLFFNTQPDDRSAGADYPIKDYAPIQAFLSAHYEQVDVIDGTTIYRLVEP